MQLNTIYNIIFIRIFGTILSVLIFTNLISNIKYYLGINIFTLIYLFLLIISILNEFEYWRNKILIKINCIFNINGITLLKRKFSTNIITRKWDSRLLESHFYNMKLYIWGYLEVGSIWEDIKKISKYKNKPNYQLYDNIKELIDNDDIIIYYIWFKYYNWKAIILKYTKSEEKIQIHYEIIQYHYKIFKTYLFLVWDLQNYLGYDIRKSLILNDANYLECISFKLNNKLGLEMEEEEYIEKIKDKKEDKFWGEFNLVQIKYYDYRTIYNSLKKIKDKDFDKYREIVNEIVIKNDWEIKEEIIKQDISIWYDSITGEVKPYIYNKEIEEWYKEWLSEQHLDKKQKYEEKLINLDYEWKKLYVNINKIL